MTSPPPSTGLPQDGFPVDERWEAWMGHALELARSCGADVPVGACVYAETGSLLGTGLNERERRGDPTAHAEVEALRAAAAAVGTWRLAGCTLVVTLEPCVMCAGALVAARVARVVWGAYDAKAGAVGSVWDVVRDRRALHQVVAVGGVREAECSRLLSDFFGSRRAV
ncbi:nucleoside deaminase [Arsenicicoccus dermatophilus]|uniref:nucleoside deaminase n=1 Tax=Arsenicicoccus dermatophilus TaxID=1076331 RepID=UPI0038913F93